MKDATRSSRPGVLAAADEVTESSKLRREVRDLFASAAAEAAADLSSVSRGCRSADILTRGDAIRARHGLSPNPVGAQKPGSDRERLALAARRRRRTRRYLAAVPSAAATTEAATATAKRPCPKCGRLGNPAATLCGYCWSKLTP